VPFLSPRLTSAHLLTDRFFLGSFVRRCGIAADRFGQRHRAVPFNTCRFTIPRILFPFPSLPPPLALRSSARVRAEPSRRKLRIAHNKPPIALIAPDGDPLIRQRGVPLAFCISGTRGCSPQDRGGRGDESSTQAVCYFIICDLIIIFVQC